jgi:hypothetical protein
MAGWSIITGQLPITKVSSSLAYYISYCARSIVFVAENLSFDSGKNNGMLTKRSAAIRSRVVARERKY